MALLDTIADATGASTSQLLLILLLLSSVPLSLVFPHLPQSPPSPLPHLFSALPAFLFLYLLGLTRGAGELLASSVTTWVIAKIGVQQRWGKALPWTVFGVVMGHLAVNHVSRHLASHSIDEIEITGSQMVLCMKLISFAWSVYDGCLAPLEQLDSVQKSTKIDTVPGLIEFIGYCFFFPSILAGPSFTFKSYQAFTSHALFLSESTPSPSNVNSVTSPSSSSASRSVIPSGRRRKALKRFGTGLVYLGIYSVYSGRFSYFKVLEPQFLRRSFFSRLGFMQLAGFVARTKYYSVWCIAESAFILSGLGYSPQTGKYDASRNVRIRSIELAPNVKVLLDSWNMNTNVWLRECIYKRVAKKGKKPGFKSTQITFITSALWHGVNPCYLMTFVLGGFAQSLGRSFRKLLRPLFLPVPSAPSASSSSSSPPVSSSEGAGVVPLPPLVPSTKNTASPPPQTPAKWAYDISGMVGTQLVLNFIVAPFMLLTVSGSLEAWRRVGWYGLVMVFGPIVLLGVGGLGGWLKSLQRGRVKRAERAGGGRAEEEEKGEKERREWEKREEGKRLKRGEGVASLGLDVEELMEREMREEREAEERAKKRQ